MSQSLPTGLIDMFVKMIQDWSVGTTIGILFIVIFGALLYLIACLLFSVADFAFRPRKSGEAKVMMKWTTEAHYVTDVIGEVNNTYRVPKRWYLKVQVDGQQDQISVTHEFHDSINEGGELRVDYLLGRFTGDLKVVGYCAR